MVTKYFDLFHLEHNPDCIATIFLDYKSKNGTLPHKIHSDLEENITDKLVDVESKPTADLLPIGYDQTFIEDINNFEEDENNLKEE